MSFKVAERGVVPPFIVMDVMRDATALEAAGRSIIHLEVGQPSTGMPKKAAARVAELLAGTDPLGYTVAAGIPALSARISRYYAEEYGVGIPADRIFGTIGSSAAFVLAFLTAFEAGDRVALASPGYPAYRHILKSLGIVPELIAVDAGSHYQLTVDHLKKLPKLPHGVILASPANPTGSIMPVDAFKDLAQFCDKNGIRLISDEIYHGISYGPKVTVAASVSDSAIVVNSFSKYFSMTGWRMGWLVIPEDLKRPMECLAQNLFISAPTVAQYGALFALDCKDELEANVARYARNRDVLLKHLPEMGFAKFAPADGAFYIYADISNMSEDSMDFCRRLLHEAGVAITPGIDFDPFHGRQFVRFSFAGSTADMEEACERLKTWRAKT
ncbi:MAG: aminotransferase class I/II-fold pyridoxal phosphate-dependent enzyme [Proteobacteria bacterium]|nr:aminotransferase class I/II-fold pyridoxal phosphate-dependent enzyme [Pseudomonadota bacterium]